MTTPYLQVSDLEMFDCFSSKIRKCISAFWGIHPKVKTKAGCGESGIAQVYRYDDTFAWLILIDNTASFTRRLLELRCSSTFKAGPKFGSQKCIQNHAVTHGNTFHLQPLCKNCWTVQSCPCLWHFILVSTWEHVEFVKGCDWPCVMESMNVPHYDFKGHLRYEEYLKVQVILYKHFMCCCTDKSNHHSLENKGRALFLHYQKNNKIKI